MFYVVYEAVCPTLEIYTGNIRICANTRAHRCSQFGCERHVCRRKLTEMQVCRNPVTDSCVTELVKFRGKTASITLADSPKLLTLNDTKLFVR